ncbi:hypothetical protein [Methanoplanus endosymbiosus]|uniref:Uncharacterized protein n=1 Tax=Methanoplanus endosymbiosus TaxID=33865 RepID=A0A9E7TME8_9EURY|nr:hypothetical protein [Methanoplanus endosymbiosus]UUX93196.1 hypothetical protein L6E24_03480 [Methanoplanus endosymbiosus]
MIYILNVLYKGRCFRSDRGYNSKKLNKLYLKKYPGKDYLKFDDAVSYLLNGSYISEVKKKDIKYYIIDIKKVSSALDSHGISIAKGGVHKL